MKFAATVLCLLTMSHFALADKKPAPEAGLKCPELKIPDGYSAPAGASKKAADIKLVVYAVQQALLCYQQYGTADGEHLPPLQAATFDFKTSTSLSGGPSVSFFILTLGAGVEKDSVRDFSLSYSVPPKGIASPHAGASPDLVNELATLIRDAAAAASSQKTAFNLPLNAVTVSVQFGIQVSENAGINFPISFVTAGAKLAHNKNTADTVTLTFKDVPAASP
jgi:hypothetical protein